MDINLKKSPDIYESEKALKFYLIDFEKVDLQKLQAKRKKKST